MGLIQKRPPLRLGSTPLRGTAARICVAACKKFDTPLASDDFELESEDEESFIVLHTRRGSERVRELMGELPPDQAQILAKVYMEGKSHSEAAAELDLPLGTVKSRVRLAIQKLQALMEA